MVNAVTTVMYVDGERYEKVLVVPRRVVAEDAETDEACACVEVG